MWASSERAWGVSISTHLWYEAKTYDSLGKAEGCAALIWARRIA
jgi:hypothetical protein